MDNFVLCFLYGLKGVKSIEIFFQNLAIHLVPEARVDADVINDGACTCNSCKSGYMPITKSAPVFSNVALWVFTLC